MVVAWDVLCSGVKDDGAIRLAYDPKGPWPLVLGIMELEMTFISGRHALLIDVITGTIKDETTGKLILILGGIVEVNVKLLGLFIYDLRRGQGG